MYTSFFFSPQWGRLVHSVLAVRTGVSALLPQVWPPASPLPAERRCPALPPRPSTRCPAHQWRGEGRFICVPFLFIAVEPWWWVYVCRFWLKFAPGNFLHSLNAIRKPVKVWQWVRTKHTELQTNILWEFILGFTASSSPCRWKQSSDPAVWGSGQELLCIDLWTQLGPLLPQPAPPCPETSV